MVRSLGCNSAGVQLRVCDRGPGVPVQWRERIFELFFPRLGPASEQVRGVVLGLALVKAIAAWHGATERCEDREGGQVILQM
jgi:K+-sensing histidine kinase KdpD